MSIGSQDHEPRPKRPAVQHDSGHLQATEYAHSHWPVSCRVWPPRCPALWMVQENKTMANHPGELLHPNALRQRAEALLACSLALVDAPHTARQVILDVGHTHGDFNGKTCTVMTKR